MQNHVGVVPHGGTWIEIRIVGVIFGGSKVGPHGGTLIEIIKFVDRVTSGEGRTSRRYVD